MILYGGYGRIVIKELCIVCQNSQNFLRKIHDNFITVTFSVNCFFSVRVVYMLSKMSKY